MLNLVTMCLSLKIVLAILCVQAVTSTFNVYEEIKDCPKNLKRDKSLVSYYNRCYTFHKSPRNFKNAQKTCKDDGGYLMIKYSIQSIAGVFARNGNLDLWIGLNYKEKEKDYFWIDGTKPNKKRIRHYMDLEKPAPMENCVTYNTNTHKWLKSTCDDQKKAFLCEFKPMDPPPIPVKYCPEAWPRDYTLAVYDDSCYKFHSSTKHFDDAEATCKKDGGYLMTMKSPAVTNFIKHFLKSTHNSYKHVWIGLRHHSDFLYEWSDGSKLERKKYENFMEGEGYYDGNIFSPLESCIAIDPRTGQWKGWACEAIGTFVRSEKKAFICEFKPKKPTTTKGK